MTAALVALLYGLIALIGAMSATVCIRAAGYGL